ncbi:MAG: PIG-L family deacetylase [Pirellula sp.]
MKSVLALFAHPDDIEFVAAGTLLLLRDLGWKIHYCNFANGCCGSTTTDRQQTSEIRLRESQNAAQLLDADFYPPICDDLDIFYNRENLAKVAAIVRSARPSIVLTHAPVDYMEDHTETCRLAVTAAFAKGIPNFRSVPQQSSYDGEVAIYHAQPHGNRTPLGEIVYPDFSVNIDSVMDQKLKMLNCHQSQQAWLQSTQKMNSYLQAMIDLGQEVARLSKMNCEYAEGWRRHLHLGFSSTDYKPLEIALSAQRF